MFYVAALLFFIPYVIVPASLGTIITMILVRIFPRLKTLFIVLLGATAIGLFIVYIRSVTQAQVTEGAILLEFLRDVNRTQLPYLPTYWTSEGILSAGKLNKLKPMN